jgi:hypothetical protein
MVISPVKGLAGIRRSRLFKSKIDFRIFRKSCRQDSLKRRERHGGNAPEPGGLEPRLLARTYRDEAIQTRVLGLVDHTHAAELFDDAVREMDWPIMESGQC